MSSEVNRIADHIIVSIADLLRDGEKVYIGLNSYVPLLAVAVAKVIQGKNLDVMTVAEAHNPELESIRLVQSTGDPRWAETSPVLITIDAFDLAQKGLVDVMFLGPVQIDSETNFNLSVIGSYERPRVRLTGGAASAFIAPLVKRLILWNTRHSRKSLVDKVDFVTATAKNADNEIILCTNLCIFQYSRPGKTWMLKAVHPWATAKDVEENTGFRYVEAGGLGTTREPTEEERALIKTLDPNDLRLKGFY